MERRPSRETTRSADGLWTLAVALVLTLSVTTHAAAEPITFNFEGMFKASVNPLIEGIPISGSFTFESTSPDSPSSSGFYPLAFRALEFTTGNHGCCTDVDNLVGFTVPPITSDNAFMIVQENGPLADGFVVYTSRLQVGELIYPLSDPTNPVLVPINFGNGIMELIWTDYDKTMFSSTDLPLTPFDITLADLTSFYIVIGAGARYDFDITSLTRETSTPAPVPEPASLLLFSICGSAALFLHRRPR